MERENIYRELDEQVKNLVFDVVVDHPENGGEIKSFVRLVYLLTDSDPVKRDHVAFVASRYAFQYSTDFDDAFAKFAESDEPEQGNDQIN